MSDDAILTALFFAICAGAVMFWFRRGQTGQSFHAGPGTYVIGRNIPAGKFDLVAEEGCGDFCIRERYQRQWHHTQKLGLSCDDRAERFRNLTLKKGDTLQINGDLWLATEPSTPIQNLWEEILEPGNYKIGTDLPSGTYHIDVLLGEGSVFNDAENQNGQPFFQDMAHEKDGIASRYKNLPCEKGTTLYVRGNLRLQLTPAKGRRRWRF